VKLGMPVPARRLDLPAASHLHARRLQPLDQAGIEQRTGTVLLAGCVAAHARRGPDEGNRSHYRMIAQANRVER